MQHASHCVFWCASQSFRSAALPLPPRHLSPAPTCRHSELFFPLAWGAGEQEVKVQDQAHGPAQQQRDKTPFGDLLAPFARIGGREHNPRPANVIIIDAPDFLCRSNVCTSQAGHHISYQGERVLTQLALVRRRPSVLARRCAGCAAPPPRLCCPDAASGHPARGSRASHNRASVQMWGIGPGQLATPLVTTHSTAGLWRRTGGPTPVRFTSRSNGLTRFGHPTASKPNRNSAAGRERGKRGLSRSVWMCILYVIWTVYCRAGNSIHTQ